MRTNNEHHVLALKDFRDEDFENILKQPPFCSKHEKKLEFFCQVCKITICYSCAVTDHEGHAKIVLEDAAKERKLRIARAVEFKKRKAQKKVTRIAKLGENCIQVQEEAARVRNDIQQFTDNLIAAIKAKKNEICDEVEMKAKQCLDLLGEKTQEIEKEMKRDQTAIEKSEMILKRSTSAQIMQPNDFLDELFRKESEQEDTVDLDGEHVIDFFFERNEELFNDVQARQLGFLKRKTNPKQSTVEGKGISEGTVGLKAEIVVKTRTVLGEQVYDQNNRVTMQIRNREGHDCSTKPQIHDNKDGCYKISYFAKESGICQACVKVNGQHVRGSPFKTELKPRLFKPVLSFGKPGSAAGMFNGPWGLAVNDKDEIAVTDSDIHRIQTFKMDGTHLRSFGREGNQQGQFNSPTGLAFYNNNIIVSDTDNHRVQIFDDQGHYLDQFGENGELNHQLQNPHGLSIDSDGNIIVADSSNKSIKIFTLDGRFLQKIGGDGSFIDPIHCIRHDSYFIVSDYEDSCIKVFDNQGRFLYKFGKRGAGDGEFDQPCFLSMDRVGHLLVCDLFNQRVQVFKLNGEFVTKFGACGEEEGNFTGPISTAILSDGRIIVTDFGNNRVQVFE